MSMLDGRICIVTGAAGSLGLASAARFAAEGAKVMLVDRDRPTLDAALKSLPKGQATAMLADVTSAKDTQAYVDATVARWGPIDVLFSNAGISGVIRPVTDYPEDVFDAVVAVNLKGAFLACKHALPRMRDGGSIIMTSSVVGVTSDPGIAAYAASKHGVIGITRAAALDLAKDNIRVNCIQPGAIETPLMRSNLRAVGDEAEEFRKIAAAEPLGRVGRPEEIATMTLFLASDEASFVTGSPFAVDGGLLAKLM
jgi:NAD(P)-dependent dehydrogenase (short-subunit alcohol dehydrogenase family)